MFILTTVTSGGKATFPLMLSVETMWEAETRHSSQGGTRKGQVGCVSHTVPRRALEYHQKHNGELGLPPANDEVLSPTSSGDRKPAKTEGLSTKIQNFTINI